MDINPHRKLPRKKLAEKHVAKYRIHKCKCDERMDHRHQMENIEKGNQND